MKRRKRRDGREVNEGMESKKKGREEMKKRGRD